MSSQPATRSVDRNRRRRWGDRAALVVVTIGALLMMAPFLWLISTSLRPLGETFDLPPTWLPTEWDFSNYGNLLDRDVPLGRFFWNSTTIALLSALGLTTTGCMAGYAFAKLRFPFRNAVFVLLLTSLMIPVQVTIVPLFVLMHKIGLVDTQWALTLPALSGAFAPGLPAAFGIFMMRQFFAGTPDSLLEAARIDGANSWMVFWRVALPLAAPGVAALFVISLTLSWNDFFLPLVFLNSIDQMTLPVGIIALREPFTSGAWTLSFVVLAMLPVLATFLASQRWIIASFTRSGMKE